MDIIRMSTCYMLQLLGDFVPQTSYWGFAPGPRWGTFVPRTPAFDPQRKLSNLALDRLPTVACIVRLAVLCYNGYQCWS